MASFASYAFRSYAFGSYALGGGGVSVGSYWGTYHWRNNQWESDYWDHVIPSQDESDTVTFAHNIATVVSRLRAVSDTLTITDAIGVVKSFNRSISDTIAFSDQITRQVDHYANVSDTIAVTADGIASRFESIDDTVALDHVVGADLVHNISHSLALTDVVSAPRVFIVHVSDVIDVSDEPDTQTKYITDRIAFVDAIVQDRTFSVSHSLTFSQSISRIPQQDLADSLAFADAIVAHASKQVTSTIVLSDAIGRVVAYHRSVASAIILVQGIIAWAEKGGLHHVASCIDEEDQGLGECHDFVLTYPFVSPSVTLTLRVPEFNNSHATDTGTVNRRTSAGQLISFVDPAWPQVQVLKWAFRWLTQAQKDDLFNFLQTSAGDEVGIRDHECRQWRGVILDPQVPVAQSGIGCRFETELSFQGALA